MSGPRDAPGVRLILLDIEGTTTPVTFVTDVLFPYARRHLRSHLSARTGTPEYAALSAQLRGEHRAAQHAGEEVPSWNDGSAAATLSSVISYVEWLMDRDRKSTALKELQGVIWEDGYRRGELRGEVFPDVPPSLRRWRDQQVQIGVFSSGSVLAQQLLFRHSSAGDLTDLLQWHFDTHIGAKGDSQSYRRIANAVGTGAETVLFLSDVLPELDAARSAGMAVRLVVRPGNAPVGAHHYDVVQSLNEVIVRAGR